MAKRLALIVAMLFIPVLAKADSFVSVVMNPQVFDVNGGKPLELLSFGIPQPTHYRTSP
jgi:hypothetical protein